MTSRATSSFSETVTCTGSRVELFPGPKRDWHGLRKPDKLRFAHDLSLWIQEVEVTWTGGAWIIGDDVFKGVSSTQRQVAPQR